jgi:transcriptional regulator with XRE-family HTH domain
MFPHLAFSGASGSLVGMSPRPRPEYFRTAPLVVFGNRIRALRMRKKWSQEQLAHKAGRHFTFVSSCERGERAPTLITILDLADALGVDPGLLVTRTPPADLLDVPEGKVRPGGRRRRKPRGR